MEMQNPIVVPGKLDSLKPVTEYVLAAAGKAGLAPQETYRLRLAVEEIATNIITHGYAEAGLEGDLHLHAEIGGGMLKVTIEDEGVAYDPTQKPLPDSLDLGPCERPIGGLGVFLAIQSVDEFLYERVGTRNRNIFIVNLPSPRAEA